MKHQYKDIPGYESLYKVSSIGVVVRKNRKGVFVRYGIKYTKEYPEKEMRQQVDKNGYKTVTLCRGGDYKTYKVHRLVMMAFVGISKLHVNHINGIKEDNSISNLEYVTPSENNFHKYKSGLQKTKNRDENKKAKIKTKDVIKIKEMFKNGINYKEIAGIYNIHPHTIYKLIKD